MKIILLACGSFSPPTFMHLRMLEMAREHMVALNHTVELGVLSPVNDKYPKPGLLKSHHRVKMCRLATIGSDWIKVWDYEANQPEWTRTALVIAELEKEQKDAKVMLVAGADMLESFNVSGLWSDEDIRFILARGMIVIPRNRVDVEMAILKNEHAFAHRSNIHIVPLIVENNVSSTLIRLMIKRGLSIKYLVDDKVIDYIEKEGLYRL